jgi:hypothetical protein
MLKLLKITMICELAIEAHAQIEPTIPLGVKPVQIQPVQIQHPMETYRRAQEIRNLQLQNEQLRLQNESSRAGEASARTTPPSLRGGPAEIMAEVTTHGLLNLSGVEV